MTDKDIKPIPKYIEKLIERRDKKDFKKPCGNTRFYSYVSRYKKELIKITVAVKMHKGIRYYKQVAVHAINAKKCFVKDMAFYFMGGYIVSWHAEGIQRYPKWYEDGKWYFADDKCFDPYAPVVNIDYILKFPEYKYSAITEYKYLDYFKYLRLYKQYPQAELLVKFGLSRLATSKQILQKATKDKAFRKWLANNRAELASRNYYINTILIAYKKGRPLDATQKFECFKKGITNSDRYKPLKMLFIGEALERFYKYLQKNNTDCASYFDYYKACEYLKLDMTEEKNLLPHDFKRWHDERIEQYKTLWHAEQERWRKENAIRVENERTQRIAQFAAVSKTYSPLTTCTQNGLIIVIAKTPADLVQEGQALSHCVGGIDYTKRMADGKSLIFFVRNETTPDVPFVTLEYSVSEKKVLQCYAYKNTTPDKTVLDFVYDKWLPFANNKIAKIKRIKRAA